MSKKKISNRLDKLFEDIGKEPDAKKGTGQGKSSKKPNKVTGSEFLISTTGEYPDPDMGVNFPHLVEKKVEDEILHQASLSILSTAFRTDEKNWATLKVVDESKQRNWGVEEQMLVKQVADQLSLALENARLFQEAQRRAKEMTALADVAREISASLEIHQVMERISNQAKAILNAVSSAVYVPDPEFHFLTALAATGVEENEIKADKLIIGKGIVGNIAASKVARIANDIENNPVAITIEGTENRENEHLMAAPILSKNQLSGILAVWRVGENEQFSETELDFLISLAQQAAIVIENARLFAETQDRAEELSVLNEMARELSAEMNIFSIVETSYRYISRLIDTKNFFIALLDEQTNLTSFPLFIENNERINIPARKLESGLIEHVIQSREPLFLTNNASEQLNLMGLESSNFVNREPVLCWLGVPLLVGIKTIGVLTVQSFEESYLYTDHDKELMTTIASQVAIAMENARLFRDAQARARREKILREITARIRATNDPEMIAKAAIRELGQALGVPTFIRLGNSEVSSNQGFEVRESRVKNGKASEGGI